MKTLGLPDYMTVSGVQDQSGDRDQLYANPQGVSIGSLPYPDAAQRIWTPTT